MNLSNQIKNFLKENVDIILKIDKKKISKAIELIETLKKKDCRLFFAGNGGGAGHASHATNDFKKICNIESYCLSDNISELTAQINDAGWVNSYKNIMRTSNFSKKDILFVFSVGGGDIKKKISLNITNAIKYAKEKKGKIISVVSERKSYCSKNSDVCITIPNLYPERVTPHTESIQALIWHLMVSNSKLKVNKTKW
jgi:D-sedoheptulose 7-phosphate isomerase